MTPIEIAKEIVEDNGKTAYYYHIEVVPVCQAFIAMEAELKETRAVIEEIRPFLNQPIADERVREWLAKHSKENI